MAWRAALSAATDPNLVAVQRAGIDPAHANWLVEVAGLADGRLDSVRADWRQLPDRDVLRAAAYGLLLGLVATRYPTSREVVSRVAEAHPSFEAFPATRRLGALERLCASPELVVRWIGPLLGTDDPDAVRPLCDFGGPANESEPSDPQS